MPTKTIAYLRVSTEKHADRGVSLDAQRAKVAAYAELYDLELVETIVDAGESAKSLDDQACGGRLRCSRTAQLRRYW
jgi:DNA invertase Pin-like site-specific DNA recombinase